MKIRQAPASSVDWPPSCIRRVLFGTDEIERGAPPKYYNSAFILDDTGATAAVYRKVFLVPFGEYVPFGTLLTFVGPLVEAVSAFSPGQRVTMLPVKGHMVSTAICYEVVYPHLIRDGILQGSELLTTITNDAWYGETSAPVPAFRARHHARDRAGPLPRARRQHRHQRHRRSLRPRLGAHRALRNDDRRRRGAAAPRADASMRELEIWRRKLAVLITLLGLGGAGRALDALMHEDTAPSAPMHSCTAPLAPGTSAPWHFRIPCVSRPRRSDPPL